MGVCGRSALKRFASLTVSCVVLILLGANRVGSSGRQPSPPDKIPVLLELFTSEGCSSCPPADELLARLDHDQPVPGVEIIAVEEHVDYWNHDGWFDPYSSLDWTLRQTQYVDRFKGTTAYTPQLVINGERAIVGSRGQEILQAIQESARQERANVTAKLQGPVADRTLKLDVRVDNLNSAGAGGDAEVWLAVAERDVASKVKAGENAGKELHHSVVLRSLKKVGTANPKGDPVFAATVETKLGRDWKAENIEVIVLVQEKKSKHVLGAGVVRNSAG